MKDRQQEDDDADDEEGGCKRSRAYAPEASSLVFDAGVNLPVCNLTSTNYRVGW